MKIAIIGYGKMGREVEAAARNRGHEVVCVIDVDNRQNIDSQEFASADVVMEFSVPTAAWDNIRAAWGKGKPVVSGTTAWLTDLRREEVAAACAGGATLLWAPNFSISMNVVKAATELINSLLSRHLEYTVKVHEVHHQHKVDHPSGSAIMLANSIIETSHRYSAWLEPTGDRVPANAVPVTCDRIGEVAGIHTVKWESDCDAITLEHTAKSRSAFATGAIVAAEWLHNAPKGHLYSMHDVINNPR